MYRLISYNVHSGIGRDGIQDYQRIGQFLARQNADFVLIQEMDTRSPEREVTDDIAAICANGHYGLIAAPTVMTNEGWYGNAILTRHPVFHRQQFDISFKEREPRTLQHVVTCAGGQRITLLNTHLGLKKAERKHQVQQLNDIIQQLLTDKKIPGCLGGDMNEWWLYSHLFKSLDSHFIPVTTGCSFPSQYPILKLDRLWASSELKICQSFCLKEHAFDHFSDHLPVIMDFDIKNNSQKSSQSF